LSRRSGNSFQWTSWTFLKISFEFFSSFRWLSMAWRAGWDLSWWKKLRRNSKVSTRKSSSLLFQLIEDNWSNYNKFL
jgi:hypothetical protein